MLYPNLLLILSNDAVPSVFTVEELKVNSNPVNLHFLFWAKNKSYASSLVKLKSKFLFFAPSRIFPQKVSVNGTNLFSLFASIVPQAWHLLDLPDVKSDPKTCFFIPQSQIHSHKALPLFIWYSFNTYQLLNFWLDKSFILDMFYLRVKGLFM